MSLEISKKKKQKKSQTWTKYIFPTFTYFIYFIPRLDSLMAQFEFFKILYALPDRISHSSIRDTVHVHHSTWNYLRSEVCNCATRHPRKNRVSLAATEKGEIRKCIHVPFGKLVNVARLNEFLSKIVICSKRERKQSYHFLKIDRL